LALFQVSLSNFNTQFCAARREYFDVGVALDNGCVGRVPRRVDGMVLSPSGSGTSFEVYSPMYVVSALCW
jgi:hypothetical protein